MPSWKLFWPCLMTLSVVAVLLTGRVAAQSLPSLPISSQSLLTLDPSEQCRAAIQMAEQEHRLPPALLGAIARAESGRARPEGGTGPWPWTINAEGQGRFFDSKAEAVTAVQTLQARGIRVVDVGCLQVNLHHHPQAFTSLEDAFDPLVNARYAGLFLTRLRVAAGGDWIKATGHYHSQTPELAEVYRMRVLAGWPGMAARLAVERRHQALIAAWQASRMDGAPRNGFQVAALEAANRSEASARQAVMARQVAGRRPGMVEIADARQ